MDLRLAGRRALVTASSAGIGAAIAHSLAAEGCAVLVHGRDETRTYAVRDALRAAGGSAEAVLGDLAVPAEADAVAAAAVAFGPDVLVANAGPFAEHSWDTATPADWASAYDANVVSVVRLVQALTPLMVERGWGRVITIGSRVVATPLPTMVEYSAAKAAVVNLTTGLSRHLAGTGVTANTVSPGVIATEGLATMIDERADGRSRAALEADFVAEYAPNPVGRLGTAEDVAAAVTFLASPLADYVDGTELRVDGGITGTA